MKESITIYFDGGCRPTNPGRKYGSYEVRLNGVVAGSKSRFELGWGTNNEAEFESLIKALDWSIGQLLREELMPDIYAAAIYTDSTVVRNRLLGRNKTLKTEPQRRMNALCSECLKRLHMFRNFNVTWRGRGENVARFGH